MELSAMEKAWKGKLTPEQYTVLREKGTEKPFTGKLLENKKKGIYLCAGCGAALFESKAKFDSGTGWPSFTASLQKNVQEKENISFGMQRTEILCKKCGGHLGHVFPDGPAPTCQRYCVNSAALTFKKKVVTTS